jgi:hypothetical protein
MSQCTIPSISLSQEEQFIVATTMLPRAIERGVHRIDRESNLVLDSLGGMESTIPLRHGRLLLEDYSRRIECHGFPEDKPWLPPNALKLLGKLKMRSITEKEVLKLMDLVAERASVHFQLPKGKFVAMTFHGRIFEVSDTRVGLLKKIQNRKQEESIFVWRIGSSAFSGRL